MQEGGPCERQGQHCLQVRGGGGGCRSRAGHLTHSKALYWVCRLRTCALEQTDLGSNSDFTTDQLWDIRQVTLPPEPPFPHLSIVNGFK